MKHASRNADELITVSTFSQAELSSIFSVEPSQLHIVPNGLDPFLVKIGLSDCQTILRSMNLPKRYFLYVGSNKPWKNLDMLITAFTEICPWEHDVVLVIAGKRGKNEPGINRMTNDPKLSPFIRLLGSVSEEQLSCLYSNAIATLIPSTYEGFGYPALEAMGSGCPVIASSAASLPEIVGDAGILIDPKNEMFWTSSMISMLLNENKFQNLRKKSLERSKLFSIELMAKSTYYIYHNAMFGRRNINGKN